jgi:hypothetical protein
MQPLIRFAYLRVSSGVSGDSRKQSVKLVLNHNRTDVGLDEFEAVKIERLERS